MANEMLTAKSEVMKIEEAAENTLTKLKLLGVLGLLGGAGVLAAPVIGTSSTLLAAFGVGKFASGFALASKFAVAIGVSGVAGCIDGLIRKGKKIDKLNNNIAVEEKKEANKAKREEEKMKIDLLNAQATIALAGEIKRSNDVAEHNMGTGINYGRRLATHKQIESIDINNKLTSVESYMLMSGEPQIIEGECKVLQ
ncbi:MAG TPA: hypothetical protein DCP90_08835 [Clostridiales bacterium]|nr:MAG: hypothetical protein A2Y22_03265 [Clostridiales bacterium GWD2_32_59]HAN10700.1 hypothetical protein [Clostridiales bacterium]